MTTREDGRAVLVGCLSFAVLSTVHVVWWLAFYPAVMSPDSLANWTEAVRNSYFNLHPFLYAYLIHLLTLVWKSPAAMTLLQGLLAAAVVAAIAGFSFRRRINPVLILAVVAFHALAPQFGIYNVTLWKDIPYSISLVLLSFVVYLSLLEGQDGNRRRHLILIPVLSTLVAMLRWNGLVYLIFPSVLLLILPKPSWKRAAINLGLTLGIYLLVSGSLTAYLRVKPNGVGDDQLKMQWVGAAYKYNESGIAAEDRSVFEKLLPREDWSGQYRCNDSGPLFYDPRIRKGLRETSYTKMTGDDEFNAAWNRAAMRTIVGNPLAVLRDRVCMAGYLLGFKEDDYYFLRRNYVRRFDYPLEMPVYKGPLPTVRQKSRLPGVRSALNRYLVSSVKSDFKRILFWSILPALVIHAAGLILALRNKLPATLAYILLVNVNVLVLLIVAPAADYRYVFPSYLGMAVLPLLYGAEKKAGIDGRGP